MCEPCARQNRLDAMRAKGASAREKLAIFKRSKGCSICGYSRCAAALHFHHVGGKDHQIKARDWAAGREDAEIAKCVLVCANCHFELHNG